MPTAAPPFAALLEFIEREQIDMIGVTNLDRITRRARPLADFMRLLRCHHVDLTDLSSPTGPTWQQILALWGILNGIDIGRTSDMLSSKAKDYPGWNKAQLTRFLAGERVSTKERSKAYWTGWALVQPGITDMRKDLSAFTWEFRTKDANSLDPGKETHG